VLLLFGNFRNLVLNGLVVAVALIANILPSARAQFVQQGQKLVGSDAQGTRVLQGRSVAISADGNTAIIGGPADNDAVGAAWAFTRTAGVWNQQGEKLVGTGTVGSSGQGISVGLSADGNTAIVCGAADNGGVGAAWIFVRDAGIWSQQGGKLVGTGAVGNPGQGHSVGLSADGNTAIVGTGNDNGYVGAAWVFTRTAGVWSQQGSKLVGSGAVAGPAHMGTSVGISADGNTAIVGGWGDNGGAGAAWVFTRTIGVWSQQGSKLAGAGATVAAEQGFSVSIAGDGNTAVLGAVDDNGGVGAAWVFTRSGGVWTQQGRKLVGLGAVGTAAQGVSVRLSADGNAIIMGGSTDNGDAGAAWVFTRTAGIWSQQGSKLAGTGAVGGAVQGVSVSLSADGNTAIVGGSQDDSGVGAAWVFINQAAVGRPQQFRKAEW